MKKWTVAGCTLWILGLAASVAGLNISGDAGRWTAIAGNIIFLIGLGITGTIWLKRKQDGRQDEKQ